MERVVFLVVDTGQRIGCLLNPESLVQRRTAGLRQRHGGTGVLSGSAGEDPLLYVGGGQTELEMDLLFDVGLDQTSSARSGNGTAPQGSQDVRELSGPLWRLAANGEDGQEPDGAGIGGLRPLLVWFVWGKAWILPGLITDVSERLEAFTSAGTPRRSWMRLRMRRVQDVPPMPTSETPPVPLEALQEAPLPPATELPAVEVTGAERVEILAARQTGSSSNWRLLARLNNLDNPMRLLPGMRLALPPPGPWTVTR